MAWRGCLLKWTKTELINLSDVAQGSRCPPRPQQRCGFRREARRPETRKGNVAEETAPSPPDAVAPGRSHAGTPAPGTPAPGPPPIPPPPLAPRPSLLKPLVFTVGFTGCSFGAAAILQYESLKRQVQMAREEQEAERLGQVSQDMSVWHSWWRQLPELQRQAIMLLSQLDDTWSSLTQGQRTATGIIVMNAAVLCCWRIPSLQRTMIKYFTANPASKTRCLPMILSCFSHYSVLHLAANMYVLWTFSSTIVNLLGPEQFLAVYLSAGVVSTMVSYSCKAATRRLHPSLGASGAVMAVLAAVCTKVPEAKLGIILLPMITFTAANALKAIIAMDTAGLVLGWRVFDHAAHLGGALFGVWYVAYGHKLIWRKREPLVKFWHSLRSQAPGGGRPGGAGP